MVQDVREAHDFVELQFEKRCWTGTLRRSEECWIYPFAVPGAQEACQTKRVVLGSYRRGAYGF